MLTKKDKKKRYNKRTGTLTGHEFGWGSQSALAFKQAGGSNLGSSIASVAGGIGGIVEAGMANDQIADTTAQEQEREARENWQSTASDNNSLLAEMASDVSINENTNWKSIRGVTPGQMVGNTLKGVVSGASAGAKVGGPWGAVAGAAAGLAGGIAGIFTGNSRAKKKAAELDVAAKQANLAKAQTLTAKAGALDQTSDARSLAAYYAEGGQINPFPSSQFGSPITEFNTGGSHEENPYDGIPQGIAPDGLPNLVEEGEVKFDNYIFSDRLMLSKEDKKKYKFLKGKTYADAAKRIKKDLGIDERPNDLIAQTDLEEQLNILSMLQEEKRAKKGLRGENRMMYKNGGYMFDLGGSANTKTSNKQTRYKHTMPEHGMYTYEMQNYNYNSYDDPTKVRMPFNVLVTRKDDPNYQAVVTYTTEEDMEALERAGYTVSKNFVGGRQWTPEFGNDNWSYKENKNTTMWEGKDGSKHDPVKEEDYIDSRLSHFTLNPELNDSRGLVYNAYEEPRNQTILSTDRYDDSHRSLEDTFDWLESFKTFERNKETGAPVLEDNEVGAYALFDPRMLRLHRDLISPRQHKTMKQLGDSILATNNTISKEDLDLSNPPTLSVQRSDGSGFHNSFLQAAPAIGSAIGTITSIFDKPTYEHTKKLTQPEEAVTPITYTPTHQDIKLDRFDTNYHANKLAAQAGATRRAIREQTASNPYASTAALLAADANAQSQMGDLYRKAAEYNQGLALQEAQFNSAGRRADAEGLLKAASANATLQDKVLSRQAEKDVYAARLNMAEDQAYDTAVSANMTSLFDNLGAMGKEDQEFALAALKIFGEGKVTPEMQRMMLPRLQKILAKAGYKYGGKLREKKGYTI